jgi:histidyl-tRNA synthetase
MFRLERPQKGRLRQFHHIGAEAIGSDDPQVDVEVISLADQILKNLKVGDYQIKINTLGCAADKKNLVKFLERELKDKLNSLCQECNFRFQHNVLRILDCKNENCRKVTDKLELKNHLCPDCQQHFQEVKSGLDFLGIKYTLTEHLVRGLDYYTRTVFEITHPELGSQDALGAGGRYDHLVKELGGPEISSIGFAFGVERLILAKPKLIDEPKELIFIIGLDKEAKKESLKLLAELRHTGISTDTDYETKSLKGALRVANDLGAESVIIIGEDELKSSTVMLKNMRSGEQMRVSRDKIIQELSSDY